MSEKIPVFDIGDTLVASTEEVNTTVTRKLHQQGVQDVPHFPVDEYDIHNPEDVQEWLDEHDIEADAEKMALAYEGGVRRLMQMNDVVENLREIGEEHGPIGFVINNSEHAREFYENAFTVEEDDNEEELEDVNYEGFITSGEEGTEDPEELFEAFLEEREEPAEKFVYFGNDAEKGRKAKELGMEFVWVKMYDTTDSEYEGASIREVSLRTVENGFEEVGEE